MLALRTGIYIFVGLLSLSVAYKITPIIVSDGIPEYLNVNTDPFVKIGNGYYLIEKDLEKNWYDAYQSCREIGASLITIESIEEWNLVNSYLNDAGIYTQRMYWTSGTALADEKNHVWFTTGQAITLDIWHYGQPDNQGGTEFCDELGSPSDQPPRYWGLNDRSCSSPNNYICKAQQPATASFLVW